MAPQKENKEPRAKSKYWMRILLPLIFIATWFFIANGIYLIVMCVISDSFSWQTIVMGLFSAAAYISSYQFMAYMAKPTYNDSGQILDSGVDLNMEGGIAEHVKDLIILTTGCQLLSLFSNYFWFLWLLAPIRGFWLLWSNILGPWFFQKQQAQPEVDEKKQRKMERRMKRH